ncbi:MAG: hypothetical protein HKM04_03475, partial [Legionellales bacterium]|nr:hypothetical protein [Legionellales bacterium]
SLIPTPKPTLRPSKVNDIEETVHEDIKLQTAPSLIPTPKPTPRPHKINNEEEVGYGKVMQNQNQANQLHGFLCAMTISASVYQIQIQIASVQIVINVAFVAMQFQMHELKASQNPVDGQQKLTAVPVAKMQASFFAMNASVQVGKVAAAISVEQLCVQLPKSPVTF